MQTKKLIEGLQILQKYYDDQEDYHSGVEHDILYAYATDKPVSEADLKRLEELGWHQPEAEEDDKGNNGSYNPEEGWAAFV